MGAWPPAGLGVAVWGQGVLRLGRIYRRSPRRRLPNPSAHEARLAEGLVGDCVDLLASPRCLVRPGVSARVVAGALLVASDVANDRLVPEAAELVNAVP